MFSKKYSDYPILPIEKAIRRKVKHLYFIDAYLFGKNLRDSTKENLKFIKTSSYENLCLFEKIKFNNNLLETFSFWIFKYYHYNNELFKTLNINENSFSPSGLLYKKRDYVKIKYNLVNNWYLFNFIDFIIIDLKLDKLKYKFDIENRQVIIFDTFVTSRGIFSVANYEFRKIINSLNTWRIMFGRSQKKK